jgi:hypothetical protein
MKDETVEAADAILRRHGIGYVIVGGKAVAQEAATATVDVDVMVTTTDYRGAVQRLSSDPGLTLAWEANQVTRFGIVAHDGIPLDVVDSGAFSGKRSGQEFFDFLVREASSEVDGVRYASPEAVWYTRLLTKRWRAYAEKILTNVIDGLPADRLRGVELIAHRFGTEATVRVRIAYVREELARSALASQTGPSEH